jgi:hypothetical protein
VALADLTDKELRQGLTEALRRERIALAQYFRVLLPIVAAIAVALAVASTREPGQIDFFRAAATIIPTLLITLSLQGGFFRLNAAAESPLTRGMRQITLATFRHSPGLERFQTMARLGVKAFSVMGLFGTPPEHTVTSDDPDWIQILYEIGRRSDASGDRPAGTDNMPAEPD